MRRVVGEVRAGQRQRQNRVQSGVYCVIDWLIAWLPDRSTDCALVCGVCHVCLCMMTVWCVMIDWLIDWLMKLNSNKSQPHSILRQAPVLSCSDCVHWLIDWLSVCCCCRCCWCCFGSCLFCWRAAYICVYGRSTFRLKTQRLLDWLIDWLIAWVLSCLID